MPTINVTKAIETVHKGGRYTFEPGEHDVADGLKEHVEKHHADSLAGSSTPVEEKVEEKPEKPTQEKG